MADALLIGTREVARSETLPLAGDFGALLGAGESVSLPAGAPDEPEPAELVCVSGGADPASGALSGSAAVVNTGQIRQIVVCSYLVVGETYELRLTATLASGNVQTVVIRLVCVR